MSENFQSGMAEAEYQKYLADLETRNPGMARLVKDNRCTDELQAVIELIESARQLLHSTVSPVDVEKVSKQALTILERLGSGTMTNIEVYWIASLLVVYCGSDLLNQAIIEGSE